jgi:hypothetical protein
VNRPDVNRPNPNRPWVADTRPNFNTNGQLANRPGLIHPAVNRPVINRPNINVNRPVVVNRPVTNIDNTTINQTTINQNNLQNTVVNRNFSNRQFNNFDYGYSRPAPGYYSSLYNNWQPTTAWGNYQPMYSNYYANSSAYAGNWLASGVTRFAFSNPFYSAQPAANTTSASMQVFDYSQPIRVPQANYQETNTDLVRSEQAIRRFDDARELFRRGEYGRANDAVDEAVKILPSDPTLHQLRGLVLFARQRFPEAAAAIYSVLAVSPGWDWETVSNLYDDSKRYEEQLRELEQFAAAHPESAESQFLLAYHATILGDLPTAEAELELVRASKPDDRLAENLLASIQRETQQ